MEAEVPKRRERYPQIRVRCSEATVAKWRDLFYEGKRRGLDGEDVLLQMIGAYLEKRQQLQQQQRGSSSAKVL